MFKKTTNMQIEINELITKNKTYYVFSFISLIFSFLLLNVSSLSIANLYNTNKTLARNYKMDVYINKNVSQNSIEEIEKDFIKLDGIEQINYIDKELALVHLTSKLGISSTNFNNPLLDSFSLKVNGKQNLDDLKVKIEGIDGVKEVILDSKLATSLNDEISRNKNIILIFLFLTFVPVYILIFNIMHTTVISQTHDIEAKLYLGLNKKEILRPYYFINNIKFISAAIISSLTALNIYELFASKTAIFESLIPLTRAIEVVGVVGLFTIILFPFISVNLVKIKRL